MKYFLPRLTVGNETREEGSLKAPKPAGNFRFKRWPLRIILVVGLMGLGLAGVILVKTKGQLSLNLHKPVVNSVYAAEKIKAQLANLSGPNKIVHTFTTLISYTPQGKAMPKITYDLWQDNGSGRFKNIVHYPNSTTIQVNDGFNRWDYDKKSNSLTITHYVNVPGGGLPAYGHTVRLLYEFKTMLKNKSGWRLEEGTYRGRKVWALSFEDKGAMGDPSGKITYLSQYYFDNFGGKGQFKLAGEKRWQVREGRKVLVREQIIKDYQTLDRSPANLKKIFKFDYKLPPHPSLKERYLDAVSFKPVAPTLSPISSPSASAESRVGFYLDDDCRLMIEEIPAGVIRKIDLGYPQNCNRSKVRQTLDFPANRDSLAYIRFDKRGDSYGLELYSLAIHSRPLDLFTLGKSEYGRYLFFDNRNRLMLATVFYLNTAFMSGQDPYQVKVYAFDFDKIVKDTPANIVSKDGRTYLANFEKYLQAYNVTKRIKDPDDLELQRKDSHTYLKEKSTGQILFSD